MKKKKDIERYISVSTVVVHMTDEIKCPKCGKSGGVLKDANGYICHYCGHTFKKVSK